MYGYYKPIYKRVVFWIAIGLVIAAAVVVLVILSAKDREATERLERSQVFWENYLVRDSYADDIREVLEDTDRYNMSKALWEFSTFDVDGDDVKELFIRINDGEEGERAHTFVFCLEGKYAYLAGSFEGADYPIVSPEDGVFEAPTNGDAFVHRFYKIKNRSCVPAYTLSEKDGEYFIDGEAIPYDEYSGYFEHGVFLDWTKFTGRFAYAEDEGLIKDVEPVGEVPEKFKNIVESDLFGPYTQLSDSFIYSAESTESGYTVTRRDIFGEIVSETEYERDVASGSSRFYTTRDGGFVFSEQTDDGAKFSVVKCDKDGVEEWTAPIEVVQPADLLYSASEDEEAYYIACCDTSAESSSDVLIYKLNETGEVVTTKTISGSRTEYPVSIYEADGNIAVTVYSASTDGDFNEACLLADEVDSVANNFRVDLDRELIILSVAISNGEIPTVLGTVDGKIITSLDDFAKRFDDGGLLKVIDYGSFYLTVSYVLSMGSGDDLTSSSLFYSQFTVYGAYDKTGEVLWKAVTPSNNTLSAYLY